jgi:NAD(P)H-dependent FMN reductase
MPDLRLLLVTGSTRHASTHTAALRAAVELLAPEVDVVLHDGLAELPASDPNRDRDPLPEPVARLRDEIGRAAGVVFCTPEYAGTLPRSLKNLLDWTVGGDELYGRPAAWINVAAPERGSGADATLHTVLGYVGADLLPSSGVRVNVPRDALDDQGAITAEPVRRELRAALAAIVAEIEERR